MYGKALLDKGFLVFGRHSITLFELWLDKVAWSCGFCGKSRTIDYPAGLDSPLFKIVPFPPVKALKGIEKLCGCRLPEFNRFPVEGT